VREAARSAQHGAVREPEPGLVDLVPDAIFRIDAAGRFTFLNAGWTALTGEPVATCLGRSFAEWALPDERAALTARLAAILAGAERTFRAPIRCERHDGRPRWCEVHGRVERDARGAALGVAGTIRDVTEARDAAQRLVDAGRTLAVGTLARGVAHEVNNPLAVVVANLQYVEEELLPAANAVRAGAPPAVAVAELQQAAADGRAAALRAVRIVEGLRTVAGCDAGPRRVVSLQRIVEAAVALTRPAIRRRARVVVELGEAPEVYAAEGPLGEVLLQLLVNAAEAIPDGAPGEHEVRIALRGERGRAIVEVRDTGRGVAPEHLPRVFDPFFTTKAPGAGTGLGLAICRTCVESLGGTIVIAPAAGRGTTVRVELPAWKPAPG
jgi:PAS domain S-box-containing protein